MTLWHATTPAKLARYVATGGILPPVRGWIYQRSAEAWARRVGRTVLLRLEVPTAYPLPDHQPPGHAWWHDGIVTSWAEWRKCSGCGMQHPPKTKACNECGRDLTTEGR